MKRAGIIKNKKQTNKGITLIALVITIIVLLILAGVSIATLTGQNGILNQATGAKDTNNKATALEKVQTEVMGSYGQDGKIDITKLNENLNHIKGIQGTPITSLPATVTVDGYEIEIKDNGEVSIKGESSGGEQTGSVTPGDTASSTKKDNYTDETGKKATIPEGFKVSDKENETKIDTGLVVINPVDGSEFVWIPIETAVSDAEANGTTNKAMAINLGTEAKPQYRGLLYDFTSSGSTIKSGCTTTTSDYREPDIVSSHDNNTTYLGIMNTILGTNFTTQEDFKTHLQEEYNTMITKVAKYGGFYVGRYETSLKGDTVASKKGETSATTEANSANTWYGLYSKQKTYTTNSVQGQMIWGSQYDSMLNWMQNNTIDITSTTPTDSVAGVTARNTTRITGSVETDRLNNIYDILGNSYEWTAEDNYTNVRVIRSGYCNSSGAPSSRFYSFPSSTYRYYGSRLALYIK